MKKLSIIFILGVLQQTTAWANSGNFFENKEVQSFLLQAPFAQIHAQKENIDFAQVKKLKFQGTLSYKQGESMISVPVQINIKGFSSIKSCDLPKLELKLKNAENTIFGSIQKIDLNTHCEEKNENIPAGQFRMSEGMFYAHREVMNYRLLESLGLVSYQTKPVFMTYIDSESQQRPPYALSENYQAFFIEDKSEFIKRMDVSEILAAHSVFRRSELESGKTQESQYAFKSVSEHGDRIEKYQVALMELFQNLVMNSDWYVSANAQDQRMEGVEDELWNIKIFSDRSGRWLVVPQDFNLALINTASTGDTFSFRLNPDLKFFKELNAQERSRLIEHLSEKQQDLMAQVDVLKKDPLREQIREFLRKRINYVRDFMLAARQGS